MQWPIASNHARIVRHDEDRRPPVRSLGSEQGDNLLTARPVQGAGRLVCEAKTRGFDQRLPRRPSLIARRIRLPRQEELSFVRPAPVW
jgi:hypothetical protein